MQLPLLDPAEALMSISRTMCVVLAYCSFYLSIIDLSFIPLHVVQYEFSISEPLTQGNRTFFFNMSGFFFFFFFCSDKHNVFFVCVCPYINITLTASVSTQDWSGQVLFKFEWHLSLWTLKLCHEPVLC